MKHDDPRREALSAMADGEASANELDALFADWRSDPSTRERWHAYQLIGDALRSDELAARPERDEAFLHALRQRLGEQPVVLAPAAAAAGRRSARAWMRWAAPAAVAAGFVTVAGVLVVSRTAVPAGGDAPVVAGAGRAAPAPVLVSNGAALPPPPGGVAPEIALADSVMLRNARLDRYLSAHRGAAEGAALTLPGSPVRRVDMMVDGPGK